MHPETIQATGSNELPAHFRRFAACRANERIIRMGRERIETIHTWDKYDAQDIASAIWHISSSLSSSAFPFEVFPISKDSPLYLSVWKRTSKKVSPSSNTLCVLAIPSLSDIVNGLPPKFETELNSENRENPVAAAKVRGRRFDSACSKLLFKLFVFIE